MTKGPGSLTIRAGTDVEPAVGDLLASCLDCDPDASDLPGLLREGPYADPELHLVALLGDAMAGIAVATVRARPQDAPVGHLDLLAVAPAGRGQGIGRALLEALEDRVRARGAELLRVGGNAPCYAWPGVDVRYTGMVELLRSAGYHRRDGDVGEAVNMSVDLAGRPPWLDISADEGRLAAAGIAVHRLAPGDQDFARFMTGWTPHLAWEVERAARRHPSACYTARRAGTGEYLAFACHHSNRAGWFGPMGTDPSVRGLGIGSVLLRRCLADLTAEGRQQAEIAWVGPVRFYARGVGARISRVFWLFEKEL